MTKCISLTAIAATIIAATPSVARDPVKLSPVSEWQASRSGNQCIMVRKYEEPDGDPVTLVLRPGMFDESLIIMLEREKGDWSGEMETRLVNDTGTVFERASARTYKMSSGNWITFISTQLQERIGPDVDIDRMTPAEKRADHGGPRESILGEQMSIEVKGQFDYDIATPGMGAAMRIMERCTTALRKDFSITKEAFERAVIQPTLVEHGITSRDYPSAMMRAGQQSRPLLLIWVGVDGKVDDCKIVESAGYPEFDKVLCKLIKRAEYLPAEDGEGNLIRAPMTQRLVFAM